jgi:hypothetical protein
MTRAEKIALVCDYIRSKPSDHTGYVSDAIGIANVGVSTAATEAEADNFLATAEAMNFSAIGEWIVDKFVAMYLDNAITWSNNR